MNEKILIVDDEETAREALSEVLTEEGYEVSTAQDGYKAVDIMKLESFDLVLCDIIMPGMGGMEVLKQSQKQSPGTIFVIMTAFGTIQSAVDAMTQGASDYVVKPFNFDEFLMKLKRLFKEHKMRRVNISLKKEISQKRRHERLIGQSVELNKILNLVNKIAPTSSTVLITGASGTGKELVARAIHDKSPRKDEPFLPINLAAIPSDLIESELFGYVTKSSDGTTTLSEGLFKVVSGGTLFLDEISTIPMDLQGKLLRAIEQKEIIAIGGRALERVDVRILAATNKELTEEVVQGRFREDLYFRLKVCEINMPPLRKMKDDIPALVQHFITRHNTELNKNVRGIDDNVARRFMSYQWKGNVRELENMIERAMIMCEEDIITEKDLPMDFINARAVDGDGVVLKKVVEQCEREHIKSVLETANYDKKKASSLLDLSLPSLYRKIKELKIE